MRPRSEKGPRETAGFREQDLTRSPFDVWSDGAHLRSSIPSMADAPRRSLPSKLPPHLASALDFYVIPVQRCAAFVVTLLHQGAHSSDFEGPACDFLWREDKMITKASPHPLDAEH